jgi:putative ABC transport system permease protein
MTRSLRYAVRFLAARPGFTAVLVLTLALGIGVNSAIFTVVHAVLLKPLPYPDPDRVVLIIERTAQLPTLTTSWQNFQDWRDQSRAFETVAAYRNLTMTLSGDGEPERIPAKMVTASLLPMVGVVPAAGRPFSADDDRPGGAGVVLLTNGFWQRRFGGRDVIGRPITLDNQPHVVVGILPPGFQLTLPADVLLPLGPWAATLPDDRSWHPGIWPLARLKGGVTLDQARADMRLVTERLAQQYPEFNHGVSADVVSLHAYLVQNVRQSLLVLTAAVGLVLLIACANVANLLLARAVGRQREIAIRSALGASRPRIVTELITESLVVAVMGGAAGLLVALWTAPLLAALAASNAPSAGHITVDGIVLVFTLGLAVLTGLVFGIAPALQTTRVDVAAAINEGGRDRTASAAHHRLRRLLVVSEMAIATMLLVAAGLLTKSLMRLQDVSPGFDSSNLLVAETPLSPVAYSTSAARTVCVDRVLSRVRALPGVAHADISTAPPFSGSGSTLHFNIEGRPPKGPEEFILSGYRAVTATYFETMRIPLVAGRWFTETDREGHEGVAVVNATFARRFFSSDDPLAHRIQIGALPDRETPWLRVVGIAADTRQAFEAEPQPEMYVAYRQPVPEVIGGIYRNVSIVIRSDSDPAAAASGLRAVLREVDPNQPLVRVRTMEQAMADSVAQPRLRTVLLGIFSGVALALALIGVYGVMAYAVSERTHEIGVRLALGASSSDVRALVVREVIRVAIPGVALGVMGALAASQALRTLLFGVSTTDPAIFAIAAVALGLAAVVAAEGPVRRATKVDPIIVLRSD